MSDTPNLTIADPLDRLNAVRRSSVRHHTWTDGNGDECSALDFLRWRLKLPIASVAKLGTDLDAEYDLTLDDGETIRLGTAEHVLDARRARAAIFARTGYAVARLKAAEWDQVAEAIADLAETVDTGATQDAETRAWLAAFARAVGTRLDEQDREQFAAALDDDWASRAIVGAERIYVHLPALIEWTNRQQRLRLTAAQLSARLVRLGFAKRRETVRRGDGTQARRQLWSSPLGFTLAEPDDETGETT